MGRGRAGVPDIMVLAGTRPEGVKIAPLVRLLCRDPRFTTTVLDTGQQPDRVDEALAPFGLKADLALTLRRRSGLLAELAAELTTGVESVLVRHRPDAVVVHGDTTTALVGALVAFWNRIPVIHLEAGLRSHDVAQPFPEEANRAMVARCADLHLAPTPTARRNLLAEGVPAHRIVVTGNTVVDALHTLLREGQARPPSWVDPRRRLVVATVHRRENWGTGMAEVLSALARIAVEHSDLDLTLVTHPNPHLAEQVRAGLGHVPHVRLVPPLPYPEMIGLLRAATVVVTDSGGLQEEAASLGVPVVVTRETTERPEIVQHRLGDLVGTDPDRIVEAVADRLDRPDRHPGGLPFGDGQAGRRCVQAIADLLVPTSADRVLAPRTPPSAPVAVRPRRRLDPVTGPRPRPDLPAYPLVEVEPAAHHHGSDEQVDHDAQ
ncbi:non-hydrolyzing UDP-N-acetylglucosamine 2-epimerase [Micromonospora sp. SH-82]|uniref:non-hydrolyzing UDP-N-acetylglucosamine 2-epimerase n=1 Tax=Micromonospora sp. SH-82 TaxID=3132938 RepID=UPI003EB8112A